MLHLPKSPGVSPTFSPHLGFPHTWGTTHTSRRSKEMRDERHENKRDGAGDVLGGLRRGTQDRKLSEAA